MVDCPNRYDFLLELINISHLVEEKETYYFLFNSFKINEGRKMIRQYLSRKTCVGLDLS